MDQLVKKDKDAKNTEVEDLEESLGHLSEKTPWN